MSKEFVQKFLVENKFTENETYNPTTKSWFFNYGVLQIELFFSTNPTIGGTDIREFLRIFVPIMQEPEDASEKNQLFKELAILNGQLLGVKLCVYPHVNNFIYVTFERELGKMEYIDFRANFFATANLAEYAYRHLKNIFPAYFPPEYD